MGRPLLLPRKPRPGYVLRILRNFHLTVPSGRRVNLHRCRQLPYSRGPGCCPVRLASPRPDCQPGIEPGNRPSTGRARAATFVRHAETRLGLLATGRWTTTRACHYSWTGDDPGAKLRLAAPPMTPATKARSATRSLYWRLALSPIRSRTRPDRASCAGLVAASGLS